MDVYPKTAGAAVSAILFHTQAQGTFELPGILRHQAHGLLSKLSWAVVETLGNPEQWLLPALDPVTCPIGEQLRQLRDQGGRPMSLGQLYEGIQLYLSGLTQSWVLVAGHPVNVWHVNLNTVLQVGNAPVQWLARLHAQCELHGYIRDKDREDLAAIVARVDGLTWYLSARREYLRLAEWLRGLSGADVVTSYTGEAPFPGDAGWRAACAALSPELAWSTSGLGERFGDRLTWFDVHDTLTAAKEQPV